jgi:hypothetical protein
MKDFNFKHWWTLLAAAGAGIAIASIAKVIFVPGLLIGLALISFGVGEWANHPEKPQKETVEGMKGFRIGTGHPWTPTPIGIILDFVGLGLLGFGFYWLSHIW